MAQFFIDDRAVIDQIYEGSHFASFLPFNLCVVRGRSTILRNYGYTSNRYFYPCLLFEFFIYNLPATITIETSLHEIFSLRSFEICEWKDFPITDAFFRAHWYRLLCCKASVTPAQLEYLVFFNQKHEMNSSDFFNRPLKYFLHRRNFCHSQSHPYGPGTCVGSKGSGWPRNWFECTAGCEEEPTSDRPGISSTECTGPGFSAFKASADRPAKRTRPLTSYPVSQSRVFTKLVTCFHRPVTKFIT